MQVKYLDLQAQYLSIKNEIDTAIGRVISNSSFVLGPAVLEFEKAFADYCEAKHCIAVNSGTSAITVALRALDVGEGDEVIVPAWTFIATATGVINAGARPVFVDVDPVTRNLDPATIEAAITPRTKVIMPVHLYGLAADMDRIGEIARRRNLIVVEDAAQAHGARYKGKRIGSIGALACFSFYPGKNLGAYGEGGAVTTSDDELARRCRMLRDHGSDRKYYHEMVGYNARMEGIQGAVLGAKLPHLNRWNDERRRVAARYKERLSGLPLGLPCDTPAGDEQVCHIYVIESERRDDLQRFLGERGVTTLIHYPVPNHLQQAMACYGYKEGDFPVTEKLARTVLTLPIYPELTNAQVDYIAEQITAFFATG